MSVCLLVYCEICYRDREVSTLTHLPIYSAKDSIFDLTVMQPTIISFSYSADNHLAIIYNTHSGDTIWYSNKSTTTQQLYVSVSLKGNISPCMAFTNNTIDYDSPLCVVMHSKYHDVAAIIPFLNSTFGSFMQNSFLSPCIDGHILLSSCRLSDVLFCVPTLPRPFSSNICDTFSIRKSTGFWHPRRGTCSRTLTPRPGRCAGVQRWWCACGPVCQRPSSSNSAVSEKKKTCWECTSSRSIVRCRGMGLWDIKDARERWDEGRVWHIGSQSQFTYLARMVNETCCIATHRCVHDGVFIDFEHVATDAPTVVVPFAFVRQGRTDQFAGVFDYHFAWNVQKWETS